MPPIIPISQSFDQPTLSKLIDADPVVQRYRALFALFDWTALEPAAKASRPGRPAHPKSAYVKALLVRIGDHLSSTPRWRAYLLDHPLLVLELGFRPHLDRSQPYGFRVGKAVPSVRHLNGYCQRIRRSGGNGRVRKRRHIAERREAWEREPLADQFHASYLIPLLESGL